MSPTRVKITVEVPFADLKPSMDKAYREIAKSVNIPGFRHGKVPPMVIDQRFGRGVIIQEALNEALPQFYGQAVTENNLNPLAQPDVEVTKLEDGDLIEFTAEVDVRPDFDVPDFSSINVTVDAIEVPDTLVDEQLDTLRSRFGSLNPVDRPVQDGDLVVINLVARKDGEDLEDATASELSYEVGSGQMLEGLDEAIIGLSAGESATFTSELVGGPLKGEQAEIEVTVTKVQEQELPEADDEFAQTASEFDTIEELRADLTSRLTQMARLEQASKARDAVLENLIAQIDIEVPENVLNSEVEARREQIDSQLAQAQLTLEQYLIDTEDDNDVEGFWADVHSRSGDALKAQMVLDKIADEHQIGIDQNDLTQHIIRKAQQQGTSPEQVAGHMQEHPHHIEEYMTEIRRGKALALIVEAATVTDSNGEKVELSNLLPDGSVGDAAAEAEAAETVEVAPEDVHTDDADETRA
nr:trigger factor [Microlunatus panaciterrae]